MKLQASAPATAPDSDMSVRYPRTPYQIGSRTIPAEKYKSGNARLNEERDDVAVDRRADIEAASHETVPGDRI